MGKGPTLNSQVWGELEGLPKKDYSMRRDKGGGGLLLSFQNITSHGWIFPPGPKDF